MFDLQKAGIFKRLSAFILDAIILGIVAIGVILAISAVTGYNSVCDAYDAKLQECQASYGVSFSITEDEYLALSDEGRAAYDSAYEAFIADDGAMALYRSIMTQTFTMTALGIFVAFLLCEFVVPLLFGNGMTLGKKVFSIAIMHRNQTRIRPVTLFVRSILGKYAVETMVPVGLVLLWSFNIVSTSAGLTVIGILAVVQLLMVAIGKTNPLLHDAMAWTVAVDYESQMIYEDEASLMKAKEEFYAQEAKNDRTY